jgi:hypothetical protein
MNERLHISRNEREMSVSRDEYENWKFGATYVLCVYAWDEDGRAQRDDEIVEEYTYNEFLFTLVHSLKIVNMEKFHEIIWRLWNAESINLNVAGYFLGDDLNYQVETRP